MSQKAQPLQPMLKLTKKIKSIEEITAGYKGLEHDLHEITIMINQKGQYDNVLQREFQKALKRKGALVIRESEYWEDKKLKARCELEVMKELPVSSFFVPKENTNDRSKETAKPASPQTTTTTTNASTDTRP